MATQGMKIPPAFLTSSNSPPIYDSTEFYIDELVLYLTAIGSDKFTENRKIAIVLNIVGPACRKILTAASSTFTKVDEIFDLLRKLFPSSVSYTLARQKFNNRVQLEHETVMEFFSEVSALAAKCDYGPLTDDLICDKLILDSKDAVKEKLIIEQPKSKVSALEMALKIETVQVQAFDTSHDSITLPARRMSANSKQDSFQQAYTCAPKIAEAKHKDLLSLCLGETAVIQSPNYKSLSR